MGYTNKTSHYDLPQWIAGDKPSWLGDVNTAMLNIDTAIAGADASATAAESSAAAANAQVQAQEAKITKNTTDIQALTENLADTQGEVNTVKATAEGALPKSGGTMTGNLILNAAPTSDLQAATKKYVDDNSGKGALMLTGGTMTGPLYLSGAPTQDLQAATKKYVDEHGGDVNVTLFTGVTPSGEAQFLPSGFTVGGALCASLVGISSEDRSSLTLLTCTGNPLGLTLNASYFAGSIISNVNVSAAVAGVFVNWDGSITKVVARSVKAGVCFYSFNGKPSLS